MRDKIKNRSSKDDYETAVLDDMEAEAAYEAQKRAWKSTPDAAPAPRPNAIKQAYPVAEGDSTFAELKPALDGSDQEKRAAMKAELAALPAVDAPQKETFTDLKHGMPAEEAADKLAATKDALGNDLPVNEVLEKRRATRSEMKKIKRRLAEKRKEGIACDTDDELAAANLLPPEEKKSKEEAEGGAGGGGAGEAIANVVVEVTNVTVSGVGSLARATSNGVAALAGAAVAAVSPSSMRPPSEPALATRMSQAKEEAAAASPTKPKRMSKSDSKKKECAIM